MTVAPQTTRAIDARRRWVPAGSAVAVLGLAAVLGGELRSLRLAAQDGAKADERILSEIEKRPTNEAMEAAILGAMRPTDTGMARVEAELRALTERVGRLESGGNK